MFFLGAVGAAILILLFLNYRETRRVRVFWENEKLIGTLNAFYQLTSGMSELVGTEAVLGQGPGYPQGIVGEIKDRLEEIEFNLRQIKQNTGPYDPPFKDKGSFEDQ